MKLRKTMMAQSPTKKEKERNNNNKKGEKHIFVLTFSHDSHFGPYILFLPLLVPI